MTINIVKMFYTQVATLILLLMPVYSNAALPTEDSHIKELQTALKSGRFPSDLDLNLNNLWKCTVNSAWRAEYVQYDEFISFSKFGPIVRSYRWESDGNSQLGSTVWGSMAPWNNALAGNEDDDLGGYKTPGRFYTMRFYLPKNTLIIEEAYPVTYKEWSGRWVGNNHKQDIWSNTAPGVFDPLGRARAYYECKIM